MSVLAIIKPETASSISSPTMTGADRLRTPNPKEAAFFPSSASDGTSYFTIDLGGAQTVNSFFMGYCSGGGRKFSLAYSTDGASFTVLSGDMEAAAKNIGDSNRHYFKSFPSTTARYWRVRDLNGITANWSAGVVAIGPAFLPTYGHEWGSGRGVIDTGSATRLQSGAFGIDEGVTAGSWSFTLGDLTDAEVDYLYELLKSVGLRGTMLVVEDPDLPNAGHNAIHWSIFQRLDVYERLSKQRTRWALRVEEWA